MCLDDTSLFFCNIFKLLRLKDMSITLDCGTEPKDLRIKTFDGKTVFLGEYEISMVDFAICAFYVLTNTDLEENDPRLKLVEDVRNLRIKQGRNGINSKILTYTKPSLSIKVTRKKQ